MSAIFLIILATVLLSMSAGYVLGVQTQRRAGRLEVRRRAALARILLVTQGQ